MRIVRDSETPRERAYRTQLERGHVDHDPYKDHREAFLGAMAAAQANGFAYTRHGHLYAEAG